MSIQLEQFMSVASEGLGSHMYSLQVMPHHSRVFLANRLTGWICCQQAAVNRRTWEIFRSCVIDRCGEEKYQWIIDRYRNYYDISRLIQEGHPLLSEHVALFSVGAQQLLQADIERMMQRALPTMERAALRGAIERLHQFPMIGPVYDATQLWGSPSRLFALLRHDQILMDREKFFLCADAVSLTPEAWLERMCKVIVSRELIIGEVIPASLGEGNVDYYLVYRKIATGHGLVAYALKPATQDSSLNSFIVFRSTPWAPSAEDALEAYLNDMQVSIGQMGWEHARPLFAELLQDTEFLAPGAKVTIAGYSLGGVHAQRFVAEYFSCVDKATFYADPSLDDLTVRRAAAAINAMPRREVPLTLHILRTQGDVCHYVGDKHLGWGITHPDVIVIVEEFDEERRNSIAYRHALRLFDTQVPRSYSSTAYAEARRDAQLDNTRRGVCVLGFRWLHRIWGRLFFYGLQGIRRGLYTLSAFSGMTLLRHSALFD